MMLLLIYHVLLGYLLWRSWRHTIPRVDGVQQPAPLLRGHYAGEFLPLTGVLCVVLLAILADQSTINSDTHQQPDNGAGGDILLCSCYCCGWNGGPGVSPVVALVALLLPALPLVAGGTRWRWLNFGWKLDGGGLGASAVGNAVDAVYPATAQRRIDSRLILIAQTLSWSRAKSSFLWKCRLCYALR